MTEIRLEPLDTPATWRAADLQPGAWVHELRRAEGADLERGLEHARATGRPMQQIARSDFPPAKPSATSDVEDIARADAASGA
jgi:hypothetical protein